MNRFSLPAGTLIAGLLLTLQACGGDSGSAGPDGVTVTDSAGVRIVENTGDGAWSDGEAWGVEEVFRVGGIDAGTDAMFGQIISVDVDDAGRVYVADQQARKVSVFGEDGALVSSFGQAGSGPGEIGPMFMGMFERGGEVWTIDPASQGIQRFSVDGEFLGATPFNIMQGVPIRMDEVGNSVIAQRRSMGTDGASMGTEGDPVTTVGAETTDTIMVLPAGETISMQGGMPEFSFFAPEPLWDAADDGSTVQGINDSYRFEIRDADGSLTRIVSRDVEGQPVTPGVERAVLDLMRDQMTQAGAPAEMLQPILEQATFAETFPPVAQVLLEANGHLWVQRTSDLSDFADDEDIDIQDLGAPRWDVFDPDGVFLGQIELPGAFQPLRMIDGVLWGLDRDDLDVASVVGMRVVR